MNIFILLKRKKNFILLSFLLKFTIFFKIINYCILSKCKDIELPFLKDNECVSTCTNVQIKDGICIIENEIIKTQWLNNIIYLQEKGCSFINLAITETNNLYYLISCWPESNLRIFYILNYEGDGFLDKNNPKYSTNVLDENNKGRFESEAFTIKLYDINDYIEYLISISKADQYVEIYDFYNGKVYSKIVTEVFGPLNNVFTIIGTHFKLKLSEKEKKNSYLIGLLACEYKNDNPIPNFYLKKVNFTSLDIKNILPSVESINVECSYAKIFSCYETTTYYIVCFYQNPSYNYIMIVFDYNFTKKKDYIVSNGNSNKGYEDFFFKCVHFFEETGVFGYFTNEKNPIFTFKFLNYSSSSNTINNQYESFTEFKLNNYTFSQEFITLCDMIKIEDKKFIFVGTSKDKEMLIITLMLNYDEEKFSIRIYTINSKNLYNYIFSASIRLSLYKNFLAMASCYYDKDEYSSYPSLIIFSYPKTSNTSLDILRYIYFHNDTKIYDLNLELEGEFEMENNIFGYVYSGIQIINNCIESENIYFVDLNNKKIISSYFLPQKEKIKLNIPRQNNYPEINCLFKYASAVSEPEYSEFIQYPKEYHDTGNSKKEDKFFEKQKKNYVGKYSYFELFSDKGLTEIDCGDNCELCYSINKDICLSCKYTSFYDENNTLICEDKPPQPENCSLKGIIDNKCFEEISDEKIKDVYSYIRSKLINKNFTLITTENVIFQVTQIKEQESHNDQSISNVELGECEIRLKNENNISDTEDLIIFKIDIKNIERSTTYVQYEIYNPETYKQLNLDICSDLKINIYSPVNLDNETLSLFTSLNNLGYNLFNKSDSFYNDFCTPYTTLNGSDILLKDRKKDIYEIYGNQALCQNNCELLEYNSVTRKVKCNCEVQKKESILNETTFKFERGILADTFFNTLSNSNFQVLRCYKLALDLKTIFENYGRIIMTIIFFFVIILIILFLIIGIKKLKTYLKGLLKQKIYIKNNSCQELEKINNNNNINIYKSKDINKKKNKFNNKNNKKDKSPIEHFSINKIFNKNNRSYSVKSRFNNHSHKNDDIDKNEKNKKNNKSEKKIIKNIFNINNHKNRSQKNLHHKLNNENKINRNRSSILIIRPNENKNQNKKSSKNINISFPPKKKEDINHEKKNSIINNNKSEANQNIIFSNNIFIKIPKDKKRKKNKINEDFPNKNSDYKNSKDLFVEKNSKKIKNFITNQSDKIEKIKLKIKNFTSQELNTMEYKKALKYDKRTYFQYYGSLLKKKQLILFTIINQDDYNLIIIKISLFLLSFSLYFTLNGFFFSDETMHKIYTDLGKYNIIYQIPIMIYSTLISSTINIILKQLSLSENDMLDIKHENNLQKAKKKSKEKWSCLEIKLSIFFILSFLLMIFFWYFISCFCAVYTNTQIILINDTLLSFGLSMLYPFGIYLIPGIFRIPALRAKKKDKECLYKIGGLFSMI